MKSMNSLNTRNIPRIQPLGRGYVPIRHEYSVGTYEFLIQK